MADKATGSVALDSIITKEDILHAFRTAIIDYVYWETIKAEDEKKAKLENREDDCFSLTFYNPFLTPLTSLLDFLGWKERKPFIHSEDEEFQRLKRTTSDRDLFLAIKAALMDWQCNFKQERQERELPEYNVTYMQEMLAAIDLEVKYHLFGDVRETAAFRQYLACEQAFHVLFGWEYGPADDFKHDKIEYCKEAAPAEQAAEPAAGDGAAGQNERPLSAEERCKAYIKIRYELAMKINSADLRHYRPGKAGRPKKMAEDDTLEAYIKLIHGGFNKENDKSKVAYSTFKAAFKAYKASL